MLITIEIRKDTTQKCAISESGKMLKKAHDNTVS